MIFNVITNEGDLSLNRSLQGIVAYTIRGAFDNESRDGIAAIVHWPPPHLRAQSIQTGNVPRECRSPVSQVE